MMPYAKFTAIVGRLRRWRMLGRPSYPFPDVSTELDDQVIFRLWYLLQLYKFLGLGSIVDLEFERGAPESILNARYGFFS
jgi:hypothetical protein